MEKHQTARAFLLLIACLLLGTGNLSAQQNFKVLSYNVLKGLQQDSLIHQEYYQWVREISPDIVAYQEMNGFTQASLEKFAAKYGHPYAIQSKLEGFPVALSSRYPIINVQRVVANMWHSYLYANINKIHVFVIHFSPFSYRKRQEEIRTVLAHAALLPQNEKILIMGDFNAMSSADASAYKQQVVDAMKKREKEEAHIRNLNNGQIDYTVIDAIKNAGFKDTYWLTNKRFQYSIPTKKYGSANVKRIDFMWANPEIAKYVTSSSILHDKTTDHISDHYPVLVSFDLK